MACVAHAVSAHPRGLGSGWRAVVEALGIAARDPSPAVAGQALDALAPVAEALFRPAGHTLLRCVPRLGCSGHNNSQRVKTSLGRKFAVWWGWPNHALPLPPSRRSECVAAVLAGVQNPHGHEELSIGALHLFQVTAPVGPSVCPSLPGPLADPPALPDAPTHQRCAAPLLPHCRRWRGALTRRSWLGRWTRCRWRWP